MQPELIETILVDAERRVPLLARHLKRLEASCKALGYGWGGRAVEADIMITALGLATPGPHRLRLLVARDGSRNIQTAPLPPLHPAKGYALDPFLTVHSTVNVGIAKGEALNCGVWGRTGPIVSPY